jgi:hypothetical protein
MDLTQGILTTLNNKENYGKQLINRVIENNSITNPSLHECKHFFILFVFIGRGVMNSIIKFL